MLNLLGFGANVSEILFFLPLNYLDALWGIAYYRDIY